MSQLQYFNYPGQGVAHTERLGYSQAVRVGDRIEISGQGRSVLMAMLRLVFMTCIASSLYLMVHANICFSGGWGEDGAFGTSAEEQIDQTFINIDAALKEAGGKGCEQIFRVNSYHVPLDLAAMEAVSKNFRKWIPNHQPIWTCIGIAKLGNEKMKVEIEVVAYVG